MKDEEIIRHILKGDCDAYAVLIDRYSDKVYSTAYSYTHNQEEAKDLVQEIFVKAYNSLRSFKAESKFSTWLYRIAVNRCIDWSRRAKSRVVQVWGSEESDVLDTIASGTDGPEELLIKKENEEMIRNAVDSLPEIYKTVLILYYFQELQVQEICNILDCPRKTVETRLYRAKGLLKSLMGQTLWGGESYELQNL